MYTRQGGFPSHLPRLLSEDTTEVLLLYQKPCSKCGKVKDGSQYYRDSRIKKDGLMARCKDCYCAHYRETYKTKKDYYKKVHHEWYERNKERRHKIAKLWAKKNPDKIAASKKRYRSTEENIKKERDSNKAWIKKNYKAWRANTRRWYKKRYREDVEFKLAQRLRSRLRYVIAGNRKTGSALDLAGCTLDELRVHIESQFQEGMTWDNWTLDGWHLDHIKPCSSFDLTDPEQQKECFHYTNLQPLWAEDNLKKGASL